MALHPHHKADLAALMAAIGISGSEPSIVAALVDEEYCPGEDAARDLVALVRDVAEAD